MILSALALTAAAAFAGAAIYVSWSEHPARMTLDDAAMLKEWKPSYAHGALMQASLALAAGLLGLAAWYVEGSLAAGLGGLLMLANWPWTLFVIAPVNHRLGATSPEQAGPETRSLMGRWAKLHGMRSVLGSAGAAAFFIAII
jgi:hypothetical protein